MRQFESIFLQQLTDRKIRAFVFTCEEELDFAGHPVLGAAATLHDLLPTHEQKADWTFVLNEKEVSVSTERTGNHYEALTDVYVGGSVCKISHGFLAKELVERLESYV